MQYLQREVTCLKKRFLMIVSEAFLIRFMPQTPPLIEYLPTIIIIGQSKITPKSSLLKTG